VQFQTVRGGGYKFHGESIRVVTAYDLDAGQKRDYLKRRAQGE
jgi:hypothetical protein